jgi:hypothetical protein
VLPIEGAELLSALPEVDVCVAWLSSLRSLGEDRIAEKEGDPYEIDSSTARSVRITSPRDETRDL